MFRKKLIRTMLGGAVSLALLSAVAIPSKTSYAAGTDTIQSMVSVSQTADDSQDFISAASFNSTNNLPVSPSKYTHAAQFKGAKIQKGIDVSQMTGIDFAAFKETQYDILAAELRKHLDMKKIYEILKAGV